jgi:hypothetical protein
MQYLRRAVPPASSWRCDRRAVGILEPVLPNAYLPGRRSRPPVGAPAGRVQWHSVDLADWGHRGLTCRTAIPRIKRATAVSAVRPLGRAAEHP